MDLLRQWIREAEKKWLPLLESHVASLFSGTFLPSHDERHHRRVWKHARHLLLEVSESGANMNREFVCDLLHAAWFHDAGMAADPGEAHGRLGREMYRSFIPDPTDRCARAILLHDRKEELQYRALGKDPEAGILDFLSVADDMDAMGHIGIYRYAEIYLARGIPEKDLGIRILDNAENRFDNLMRATRTLPAVREDIRPGFEVLREFCHLYESEGRELIGLIRELAMEKKIRPEDFHLHSAHEFFKALAYELDLSEAE